MWTLLLPKSRTLLRVTFASIVQQTPQCFKGMRCTISLDQRQWIL
ncbi:hypothetical protein ANCCAN_27599 [Ancylostoma caninum]|uniref:Uncharacterized protein n=1 Tax=Ancylostoma caninum TaxID=29170 RepID=A0A368F3J7_ANCCA|nr:hypothetical protein ANCCAN_27599 [Ancylostoma caninum]